jgi:hypothetical protein
MESIVSWNELRDNYPHIWDRIFSGLSDISEIVKVNSVFFNYFFSYNFFHQTCLKKKWDIPEFLKKAINSQEQSEVDLDNCRLWKNFSNSMSYLDRGYIKVSCINILTHLTTLENHPDIESVKFVGISKIEPERNRFAVFLMKTAKDQKKYLNVNIYESQTIKYCNQEPGKTFYEPYQNNWNPNGTHLKQITIPLPRDFHHFCALNSENIILEDRFSLNWRIKFSDIFSGKDLSWEIIFDEEYGIKKSNISCQISWAQNELLIFAPYQKHTMKFFDPF